MTDEKCQQLFLNLLVANDRSPMYIREFLQTEQCDKIFDLSNERESLKKLIGADSTQQILNFAEQNIDELHAYQAVYHYNLWHKDRLLSSLDIKHKLIYYLGMAPKSGWKIAHNRCTK